MLEALLPYIWHPGKVKTYKWGSGVMPWMPEHRCTGAVASLLLCHAVLLASLGETLGTSCNFETVLDKNFLLLQQILSFVNLPYLPN